MMGKIIIIGADQARVGFKFQFVEPASACEGCKYYQVCTGKLERGRVYSVTQILKKTLPCILHEGEGRVVEVDESPVEALVDAKLAIQGAIVTFTPSSCMKGGCRNYETCKPIGLVAGDRCKVLEVKGLVDCPERLRLASVLLHR